MPGAQSGPVPVIRMYGVTMNGHSVLAHVYGFHPHFFVKAPPNFCPRDCGDFKVTSSKSRDIFKMFDSYEMILVDDNIALKVGSFF